jgi:hypothetical protein
MKIWSFMNGLKKMVCRVNACILFFLCSITSLFAEEQMDSETTPSIAFLEFLGEWETEQGEWIDPLDLEDEELGKLIETTIEVNNEN